jgi:anti-sigma regulatory factor (Ser/Thr protein kinase)
VSRLRSGDEPDRGECVLWLADQSHVGEARRIITALARSLGFDEQGCGKIGLVVSEAVSNVVKHAGSGELLAQSVDLDGSIALDLLVLDKGPGMADPARCLRDGYSTAGTPGTGLGAISRLADSFELHSLPTVGTALWLRIHSSCDRLKSRTSRSSSKEAGVLEVAGLRASRSGETVCGDSWAVEHHSRNSLLMVADGLGHGPFAAEASQEAVRVFREHASDEPGVILDWMHRALKPTRGAAVGIAAVDVANRSLRFAGVGNIAGTVYVNSTSRSTVSQNGTVGHELRRIQEFDYPFPPGALLVMHSDGLSAHWKLDRYPGLVTRNLPLVAGVLYRDFKRGRDDVTVLAAREGEWAAS